jgi:hypothetical protein
MPKAKEYAKANELATTDFDRRNQDITYEDKNSNPRLTSSIPKEVLAKEAVDILEYVPYGIPEVPKRVSVVEPVENSQNHKERLMTALDEGT